MDILHPLQIAQNDFMEAIQGISEDDADTYLVEKDWTIRDVVANITAYEHVLSDIFGSSIVTFSGGPYLFQLMTTSPAKFDAYHHQEYKIKPYQEIVIELITRHSHIMNMKKELSSDIVEEKGTLPWYDPKASIRDYINNTHLPRKKAATQKIIEAKKRLQIQKHKPSKKPDL